MTRSKQPRTPGRRGVAAIDPRAAAAVPGRGPVTRHHAPRAVPAPLASPSRRHSGLGCCCSSVLAAGDQACSRYFGTFTTQDPPATACVVVHLRPSRPRRPPVVPCVPGPGPSTRGAALRPSSPAIPACLLCCAQVDTVWCTASGDRFRLHRPREPSAPPEDLHVTTTSALHDEADDDRSSGSRRTTTRPAAASPADLLKIRQEQASPRRRRRPHRFRGRSSTACGTAANVRRKPPGSSARIVDVRSSP